LQLGCDAAAQGGEGLILVETWYCRRVAVDGRRNPFLFEGKTSTGRLATGAAIYHEGPMSPSFGRARRALLIFAATFWISSRADAQPNLRAGACIANIAPRKLPVFVNGGFTSRTGEKLVDPLTARALALDDGHTRIVLCVVDTCMMPRDLIDHAKAEASKLTGIPIDHMLVSATHTHSAPSAMGCLGTPVDSAYAVQLPGGIRDAIAGAVQRLEPAEIGWAQENDWGHTFNRRWIRRPDRLLNDPFGQPTVRAHMHPGYQSPDVTGPSGPVDPQLSLLAVRRKGSGEPLAVLANYSMHYVDSPLLSSDYFGKFDALLGPMVHAGSDFVGMMSQGTSGDLASMDYDAPSKKLQYATFGEEMARHAAAMYGGIQWHDTAPLAMAERRVTLERRAPDVKRLGWAHKLADKLGGKLPQTQPEIYAREAIELHEHPTVELKVQAIRIGDVGVAALPNEVFALTGLKIKRRSPLPSTFTVELANGSEGYIPPPEQHELGGYTTWPARTAALEVQAEPKLAEAAVTLLGKVAGRRARPLKTTMGSYAAAVMRSGPEAYWRFEEMAGRELHDEVGKHPAKIEGGAAMYLPGVDGRTGQQPPAPAVPNAFSGNAINRSVHFASGAATASVRLGRAYSVELWFWNGLPTDARSTTGYLFGLGERGGAGKAGGYLAIGGTGIEGATGIAAQAGRLVVRGGGSDSEWAGSTEVRPRTWHHVVYVWDQGACRVHLDGRLEMMISEATAGGGTVKARSITLGGRGDGLFNFEGKLDEAAVYAKALTEAEVAEHYQAAGLEP
jgi:Concanavalin A-like lectin/glucanases superfamily